MNIATGILLTIAILLLDYVESRPANYEDKDAYQIHLYNSMKSGDKKGPGSQVNYFDAHRTHETHQAHLALMSSLGIQDNTHEYPNDQHQGNLNVDRTTERSRQSRPEVGGSSSNQNARNSNANSYDARTSNAESYLGRPSNVDSMSRRPSNANSNNGRLSDAHFENGIPSGALTRSNSVRSKKKDKNVAYDDLGQSRYEIGSSSHAYENSVLLNDVNGDRRRRSNARDDERRRSNAELGERRHRNGDSGDRRRSDVDGERRRSDASQHFGGGESRPYEPYRQLRQVLPAQGPTNDQLNNGHQKKKSLQELLSVETSKRSSVTGTPAQALRKDGPAPQNSPNFSDGYE